MVTGPARLEHTCWRRKWSTSYHHSVSFASIFLPLLVSFSLSLEQLTNIFKTGLIWHLIGTPSASTLSVSGIYCTQKGWIVIIYNIFLKWVRFVFSLQKAKERSWQPRASERRRRVWRRSRPFISWASPGKKRKGSRRRRKRILRDSGDLDDTLHQSRI